MSKIIVVPTEYTAYRMKDETVTQYGSMLTSIIPQMALEMLVLQGLAKKLGVVGTIHTSAPVPDEDEGEEPNAETPWFNVEEDDE